MGNPLTRKNWWGWGIAALALWGFLFLLHFRPPNVFWTLRSLAYALFVVALLYLTRLLMEPKLRLFSARRQFLLKFVFYTTVVVTGLVLILWLEFQVWGAWSLAPMRETDLFGILALLFSAPVRGLNLDQLVPGWLSSFLVYGAVVLVLVVIFSLAFSLIDTRWNQYRVEQSLRETRLRLLEMQMKPHFLFNTLNAIVGLIRSNPPEAERFLVALSDFLRFNFDFVNAEKITLAEETHFTELYLSLIKLRFPLLKWRLSMQDGCGELRVPALFLQPIVENAVRHGWTERDRPLQIDIVIHRDDAGVRVSVADNGCGFPNNGEAVTFPAGHSLRNLTERLELLYGRKDLLRVDSRPSQGSKVTITLPEGE